MYNMVAIAILVLTILTDCNAVVNEEFPLCTDRERNLNNDCSIACFSVPKQTSRILSAFNISYHKIKVSCKSPEAWNDFSKIKIYFNTAETNHTQLVFFDSQFPEDFNLYNFTKSLGLEKIDSVVLKASNVKPFSPSKNFFLNSIFNQLEIVGLNITSLPENFLQVPPLKVLKIMYTTLNVLKHADFRLLNNLKVLELSYNKISAVETGAFENLVSLHTLDISSNNIVTLPSGIFKNLRNLTKVNLNSNLLRELPTDLFQIDYNTSTTVENNNLFGDEVLTSEFSNADNNQNSHDKSLSEISNVSIESNTSNEWLNVTMKNITKLTEVGSDSNLTNNSSSCIGDNSQSCSQNGSKTDEKFDKVQLFKFYKEAIKNVNYANDNILENSEKFIKDFSEEFEDDLIHKENSSRLRQILLNNNRLTSLPSGTFANLTRLRSVDLSANNLSSLPADLLRGARSLDSFLLNNNNLTDLPTEIFKDARVLRFLHLAVNKLKSLKRDFLVGLSNLLKLDVSNNRLHEIDQEFCNHLPNIKDILLSRNLLSNLQGSSPTNSIFKNCGKIENLVLNYNNISSLYEDWIYSGTLHALSLIKNKLKNVTMDVCRMYLDVDVRGNQITVADLNLGGLEKITEFDDYDADLVKINLGGNQWNCSCENYDLLRYIQRQIDPKVYNFTKIQFRKNEKCTSPNELKGTPLTQVNYKIWNCENQ